jgi:hypothetical protein
MKGNKTKKQKAELTLSAVSGFAVDCPIGGRKGPRRMMTDEFSMAFEGGDNGNGAAAAAADDDDDDDDGSSSVGDGEGGAGAKEDDLRGLHVMEMRSSDSIRGLFPM